MLERTKEPDLIRESLDYVDHGILILDSDLRLVAYNRQLPEILGLDPDFAQPGAPIDDIVRAMFDVGVYPKLDSAETAISEAKSWIGKTRRHFYRVTLPSGRVIEMRRSRRPDGGVSATYTDISERAEAEEQLEAHANIWPHLSEAILLINKNGQIFDVNGAFEGIFGYAREEIIGLRAADLTPDPEHFGRNDREFFERMAESKPWRSIETFRRKDGVLFSGEYSAAPILEADGAWTTIATLVRDVTERERAEASARTQAAILSQMIDAVIVIDLDRRISDCNDAAYRIYGYTREEMIGQKPAMLLADPEAWLDRIDDVYETVHKTGKWEGEFEIRRKDGSLGYVTLTLSPVRNKRGEIFSYASVVRDITEMKQKEQRLRSSERMYQTLFETSRDAITFWTLDGKLANANQAFCDMLGYSHEEIEGLDFTRVTPKEVWPVRQKLIEEVMARGHSDVYEVEYSRKDGTRFPASVQSWLVVDDEGRPKYRMTIIHDLTELKQKEKEQDRLLHILDATTDFVGITDSEGRALYINKSGRQMLGVGPDEDIGGLSVPDVLPPDDARKIRQIGMPMARKRGSWHGESHFRDKDGNLVPMSLVILRYTTKQDGEEVFSTIARDISDRIATVEELTVAKESAEMASQAKSQFLANMSHELRTPLNAIIGFSKMIEDQMYGEIAQPQYVDYAHDIQASATHLLGIINDILDLSKIEAGKFSLDETDLDAADIAEWCISTMRTRIQSAQVDVRLETEEGLPRLRGDKRALRQILLNLLSNAVKFTPAKGEITIRMAREGEEFAIAVSDTGVGIEAEKIDQIMEPFAQVDSALNKRQSGTGLGLSISKSLMEMHGGRFWLESTVGEGTTAHLRFPGDRVVPSA